MQVEKNLGDQVKMGDIVFSSRIGMTSLTRTRCDPQNGVPTDLVKEYYSQRAGSAFILTEASAWSERGHGFPGAANLYTKQQAEGWKKVNDEVHKKGCKIFVQLFHCGRATNPFIVGGLENWAPSALAIRDKMYNGQPYPVPKQMTLEDIKETEEDFRKSVILAKSAGFDGIQIHGAHGYLVDEFLRSETNQRTDQYGGSPENRVRFCLELIDIALEYFKPHEVGIKISPVSQFQDMFDKDPVETYSHLLKELSKRNIGFVEARESSEYGESKKGAGSKLYYEKSPPEQIPNVCCALRPFFNGILIANDSFTVERGLQYIRNGWADMVSFGRLYISNPDLAQRILNNQEINEKWDYTTFFSPFNPVGYTDYPFYHQWAKHPK